MIPLRRRRAVAASTLAAMCALATLACGGNGNGDDGIAVNDAWARPTAPSVSVGAAYMTLESPADDVLLGASVAPGIAERVTLHRTETAADTATMRPLDGLELPAGERVEIEPGGSHLMLEGLVEPLPDGSSFDLTLDFAEAPDQVVAVDVTSDDT